MSTTAPDPEQKPDVQILSAGQTLELLSRLLAAAILQLGEPLHVTNEDLREMDGQELQHGHLPDGTMVVRVAKKAEGAH